MMDQQIANQLGANPFIPDRPAVEDLDFVGRRQVIEDIRGSLGSVPALNPLVLSGPPGVGKTSLLRRLPRELHDQGVCVLYADLAAMDLTSMSALLWQLAKSIILAMDRQGLQAPSLEKRMLVLNPLLVFRQRFWNPLLATANATPLLLAWDNFDSLATITSGDINAQTIRAYLYELLETDVPVDLLLTATGRVEAIAENALSPFHLERTLRLANLRREPGLQLIQASGRFTVFEAVADFIFRLTVGHPGDTQRLCYALYERQMRHYHRQVTFADVVSLLRDDLGPSDFVGTVYRRLRDSVTHGPM